MEGCGRGIQGRRQVVAGQYEGVGVAARHVGVGMERGQDRVSGGCSG